MFQHSKITFAHVSNQTPSIFRLLAFIIAFGLCQPILAQISPARNADSSESTFPSTKSSQIVFGSESRPNQILNGESPAAIVVGLPSAEDSGNGRLNVFPNTSTSLGSTTITRNGSGVTRRETIFSESGMRPQIFSPLEYENQQGTVMRESVLSTPITSPIEPMAVGISQETHAPLFSRVFSNRVRPSGRLRSIFDRIFGCKFGPGGIGRERLPYAMYSMDSAQPSSNTRIRFGFDYGRRFVDRAGIYWGKIGGPGPPVAERSIDAQEFRIAFETGGEKFSTTTEIPFRAVNPDNNANHAGLGDMTLTTKTVLNDGTQWQLTQTFRSYFNTGAASSGLGTGHISFEPGLVARYKYRPQTEFHGMINYFFPVGSDPIASGQAIHWGLGGVHTTFDTDERALIQTIELTGWNVLNGTETVPNSLEVISSDGIEIVNLTHGFRWVFGDTGDLGTVEAGFATVFPILGDRWSNATLLFEFRWTK